MSWFLTGLNLVVNVVLTLLALSLAFGIYRLLSRGSFTPQGDPELAASLTRHTSKWSSRRVAVAWVDMRQTPTTRMAFLGCDETTPFELGSITKALTGLLVQDAVDRGELRLDTRLGELDDRLDGELGARTMTSLVTHTSGLPRLPRSIGTFLRGASSSLFTLNPHPRKGPDVVALAARQRLDAPGWTYSNLGAAVAGQLVAERAGVPYHDLLRERVLDPVGMSDTSTDPRQHRVKRGWTSAGRHAMPWRLDGYAPAGGAVSTLADMSALANALLRGNAPGVRAMTAVPGIDMGQPNTEQAVFFQVQTVPETGRTMVVHDGQTGGYSAFLALFPSAERAIVVLSDTAVSAITTRTATRITRDMVEASPPAPGGRRNGNRRDRRAKGASAASGGNSPGTGGRARRNEAPRNQSARNQTPKNRGGSHAR